jgi:hypothetical protein
MLNGIRVAREMMEADMVGRIREAVAAHPLAR